MASRELATATALLILGSAAFAAGAATAQDEARGQALFGLCQQCHGPEGGGQQFALAPAIAGLADWYVTAQLGYFRSGARGANPEDVGGLRMHPMALWLKTEEDVRNVSAYVASLPATRPAPTLEGGDPARGAETYQRICVACHGADGGGNRALSSPRLTGASDWYLLSSLQKYKVGVRGSYPNALLMRGMAAQLADEQAMKDVVAYIMTLPEPMAAR